MDTNEALHHYNEDHNVTSARVIVPYLFQYIEPRSVIDIGCGPGQWLQVFKQHGVREVLGVDGSHVPHNIRKIDNFLEHDLREFAALRNQLAHSDNQGKKFDLCLNLEVAEHLPEEKAEGFIRFLTDLSDFVLFSAAVPNQTGENHINEQPHKYWVDHFSRNGYVCCDIFRRKYWNDAAVNWWYRQNMFLFVQGSCLSQLKQSGFPPYDGNQYIHPELFDMYVYMNQNVMAQREAGRHLILRRLAGKLMFWKRVGPTQP